MDRTIFGAAAVAVAVQVYLSPIKEPSTEKVLLSYIGGNLALLYCLQLYNDHIAEIILLFTTLNLTFLTTATILTLLRRLYFSPLSKIPGPPAAALSKLWVSNQFRHGSAAQTFRALHKHYNSDIVRIGPNEIILTNADAVEKLYKGKYGRGSSLEIGRVIGTDSLVTQRDYAIHRVWRSAWEKAFATNELKEYSARVDHHASKLVEAIRRKGHQETNIAKLIDAFAFDTMADLSFAEDSGMQEGTNTTDHMEFLHAHISKVAFLSQLRNICQLLKYLPIVQKEARDFMARCDAMLKRRLAIGDTRKDIFTHLLSATPKFTREELDANANVIIVAGSDTTASTLTQTLRGLAADRVEKSALGEKSVLAKMQEEVDKICESGEELTVESVKGATYINAVVNEGVRLYNPAPSGIQAYTPPQGLEVAGMNIPGNVEVRVPHFTLLTDERYFPQGQSFIPERWTGERPTLLTENSRKAYIPFGYGAHSCVGKQLALNEMRIVLGRIVREFDFEFGESYDEKTFESEWKDYGVLQVGAVWLKFTPRSV